MNDEHKENISRSEIPLLYDIIHSAIKETNANYFEVIGILNFIISEMLDEIKLLNDEYNQDKYGYGEDDMEDEET